MRTVLPAAKALPSVGETLMRSSDSSEWNVPLVPSAQELLTGLGWLGSGPRLARPLSSVPESQEIPTVPHLGALSVASKAAAWPVALLLTVTVTAPLVPTLPAAS